MADVGVPRQLPALPMDDETGKQEQTRSEINAMTKTAENPGSPLMRKEYCIASSLGAPAVLRSDDSNLPLSASAVTASAASAVTATTEMTTVATVASTNSRINNISQKQKRRSSLLCGLGPSRDDEEDSSDGGRIISQLNQPNETASETYQEPAFTPFSDWMGELPLHAHELPFNQIAIPGSHDSCTATLDRDGGLHPDAPELYRDVLRIFGSWAKTVAHRWSQTQDRTFVEQLHLGIRYFDLRISVRPGFEELYLVHGFYGDTVTTCLTSICSWLDSHPKEIVLLDMNHFHGLEDHHHQKLVIEIQNIFGDKMVPVQCDARQLTLTQMWKDHQQVIVFYHHVKSGVSTPNSLQPTFNYLWPGCMIPSPWPRTTRTKDLVDFLDKSTFGHTQNGQHTSSPSSLPRPQNSFFVSQGVLTPTVYTVISHVTSSLKDHFARPTAQAVVEWLKTHRKTTTTNNVGVDGECISQNGTDLDEGQAGAEGVNIVIVDFVDLDQSYVETVVKLNYCANDMEVRDKTEAQGVTVTKEGDLQQLAPVIQIIQQSSSQLEAEPPPATSPSSFDNHSPNPHLIGCCHNPPSDLPPSSAEEASSSALSSRALTPTPLQFIDAGTNSPSVTPVRLGLARERNQR